MKTVLIWRGLRFRVKGMGTNEEVKVSAQRWREDVKRR
jgi:hypothetical protein